MKTFESQLLELLREYENYEEEVKSYDFSFPNFAEWLSKRVEEKEVKDSIEYVTQEELKNSKPV
jgi:hypothetical protein